MGLSESDGEVVAAALSAPARFGELFDRHFTTVFRYLARRVGTVEAEDLAAEVFVVAFRRRFDYDVGRASALPWLYGIATNLLRRHRRSEQRRMAALNRVTHAEASPFEDRLLAELEATDLACRVGAALLRMRARDRDALVLHAWERLSYQEVSEALGVPVGTVRSRIHRARRVLRELLGQSGEEPQVVTPPEGAGDG